MFILRRAFSFNKDLKGKECFCRIYIFTMYFCVYFLKNPPTSIAKGVIAWIAKHL